MKQVDTHTRRREMLISNLDGWKKTAGHLPEAVWRIHNVNPPVRSLMAKDTEEEEKSVRSAQRTKSEWRFSTPRYFGLRLFTLSGRFLTEGRRGERAKNKMMDASNTGKKSIHLEFGNTVLFNQEKDKWITHQRREVVASLHCRTASWVKGKSHIREWKVSSLAVSISLCLVLMGLTLLRQWLIGEQVTFVCWWCADIPINHFYKCKQLSFWWIML